MICVVILTLGVFMSLLVFALCLSSMLVLCACYFPLPFIASFGCCSVSFLIWDRKDKTAANRPTHPSARSSICCSTPSLSLSPFLENTKFVSRELSELATSQLIVAPAAAVMTKLGGGGDRFGDWLFLRGWLDLWM